jgi:antitoxin VapB
MDAPMSDRTRSVTKEARLFRNNRSQAVRIPVEFELPGERVLIYREGERLVIEPVRKRGLLGLLASWEPLDEAFPEIEDPDVEPENVL